MDRVPAEHRNLAVGGDHGGGISEDALEVPFAHRVEYAAAATVFHQPHHCLRRIFQSRRIAARLRHVGEILSRQGSVPRTAYEDDVLRVGATAFGAQELDGRRPDLGARGRVSDPPYRLRHPAVQRPAWQERCLDARARGGVWILIQGGINATLARSVYEF